MFPRATKRSRRRRMMTQTTHLMISNCMPLDMSAPIIKCMKRGGENCGEPMHLSKPLIFALEGSEGCLRSPFFGLVDYLREKFLSLITSRSNDLWNFNSMGRNFHFTSRLGLDFHPFGLDDWANILRCEDRRRRNERIRGSFRCGAFHSIIFQLVVELQRELSGLVSDEILLSQDGKQFRSIIPLRSLIHFFGAPVVT